VAEWLTVKQVADYLKLSEAQVYVLVKRDQLPAHRLGNLLRFDREEIDRQLKSSSASKVRDG
jgi:excisionase family DNA binding protein